jgi:hypothetical protein
MRHLAIVTGVGAALAILVYGAASLFVAATDLDLYREPLVWQLSKISGREVQVGRVSRLAGAIRPRIEIEELVVLAAAELDEEIARIDRAVIGLDLLPLLRGVVHIDDIELHGVRLAIATDAEGELNWMPNLAAADSQAPSGGIEVAIEDVDVEEADIVYHDGVTGDTTRSRLARLRLDLEDGGREVEVTASGEVDGVAFDLEGRFERSADDPRQGYAGSIEGRVAQGRIEASGSVVAPLQLSGVDLQFTVRLPDLSALGGFAGIPELRPVVAMGRLRDHEDQIGVEELQIEIGRGPTRAHFSGEVRDLIGSPEVEVAARVELSNTRVLAPLFEFELPELGPLRGSASLRTTNGDFHLEGLDVEVGGDGSAVVRARGSVSDLRGLREVSLDVSAASDDVRDLVPFLDAERFSFGPVRARARVVGAADALHVESIDAEAGRRNALWAHVTGRVGVLSGDLDLDLVVRFEAAHARELERILAIDLPDLGPVSGSAEIRGTGFRADAERIEVRCGTRNGIWLEATGAVRDLAGAARARLRGRFGAAETRLIEPLLGHELPALGRIEGSAELVRTKERIELNQFRVRSERDDGLQIRIEGESSELPISGGADLRVELSAPRLSTLSTLVDQNLPDVGPVHASGRLLTAADRWALHDFEAKLGETTLSGSAARVVAADGRPRLSIELAAPRIHLAPREAAIPRQRPDSDDGWWERPIPLDALRAVDADPRPPDRGSDPARRARRRGSDGRSAVLPLPGRDGERRGARQLAPLPAELGAAR